MMQKCKLHEIEQEKNSSITLFQFFSFSFSIEHFDYFVHSWSSSVKINCSFYFIFLNLFSSSNIVLLKIWLVVEMELFFVL